MWNKISSTVSPSARDLWDQYIRLLEDEKMEQANKVLARYEKKVEEERIEENRIARENEREYAKSQKNKHKKIAPDSE